MKYQVIVKNQGELDKDTISIHDNDLDATISALEVLDNCADHLYENFPENELNEKMLKAKKEIKREFYAEFLGYQIYITLFALNQSWFVAGKQAKRSVHCQWPKSIILRVEDIALANMAKYYAQLEYGSKQEPLVVPATGIWLDDTETSLFCGKRQTGKLQLIIRKNNIDCRLSAQDDEDYWAEYRLIRLP